MRRLQFTLAILMSFAFIASFSYVAEGIDVRGKSSSKTMGAGNPFSFKPASVLLSGQDVTAGTPEGVPGEEVN